MYEKKCRNAATGSIHTVISEQYYGHTNESRVTRSVFFTDPEEWISTPWISKLMGSSAAHSAISNTDSIRTCIRFFGAIINLTKSQNECGPLNITQVYQSIQYINIYSLHMLFRTLIFHWLNRKKKKKNKIPVKNSTSQFAQRASRQYCERSIKADLADVFLVGIFDSNSILEKIDSFGQRIDILNRFFAIRFSLEPILYH